MNEQQDQDQALPLPALTDGLFSGVHDQQPFISDVDVIDEKITIVNPCDFALDLTGYQVSDFHGKHVYHFPVNFVLPAHSKAVLFCCPGTRPHVDDYQVNHLLWKNKDGTMRRKEVLNNDGDTAILLNRVGVPIALCTHLGEMKLLGKPSNGPSAETYHGLQPGEHTGVIPFWKLMVLPLLLLFLMSYFFEAPHESIHTRLESVVQQLQSSEDELAQARSRATHAHDQFQRLHSSFLEMQSELDLLQAGPAHHVVLDVDTETDSNTATEGEVEALLRELKEEQNAEFEVIRAEIASLHSQISQQPLDGDSEGTSFSTAPLAARVSALAAEVDQLEDETVGMVRGFESLEGALDQLQEARREDDNRVQRAAASLETELYEELAAYVRGEGAGQELHAVWREQAEGVIRGMLTAEGVQQTLLARVEEERLQSGAAPLVGVTEESLERVVAAALTEELEKHRAETDAELQQQLALARAASSAQCQGPSASSTTSSVGEDGAMLALAQRDFALRGAGGQVVYGLTSATYSPSPEEEQRLSDYYDPATPSMHQHRRSSSSVLRSSVSGLLTGALGRVETLLGSETAHSSPSGGHMARRGFFETGVGGPDEALSQDVSLGSCWAMQGSHGVLTVRLRAPLRVSGVTLDHVSRHQATDISTAPARFAVLGYQQEGGEAASRLLLEGVYDIHSEHKAQTFLLSEEVAEAYQFIKLEISSNHGNENYTCLYRFRVHGELA